MMVFPHKSVSGFREIYRTGPSRRTNRIYTPSIHEQSAGEITLLSEIHPTYACSAYIVRLCSSRQEGISFAALKRARLDKGRWTRKSSQIPHVKGPCIAHRSTVYGSRNSSFSGQHRREQMYAHESASDESSSGMRSLRLIVCSVCIWKRQSPFEDPLADQSLPQALLLAEHFSCPCRDGMDG